MRCHGLWLGVHYWSLSGGLHEHCPPDLFAKGMLSVLARSEWRAVRCDGDGYVQTFHAHCMIPVSYPRRSACVWPVRGIRHSINVVRAWRRSVKHATVHSSGEQVSFVAAPDAYGTARAAKGVGKPHINGLALSEA